MPDLQLTWPDGSVRFRESDSPVCVGRSDSAQVVLADGSVSRQHLVFTYEADGWRATDSSTHGTYDDQGNRQPPSWPVNNRRQIHLGGTKGVVIHVEPRLETEPALSGNIRSERNEGIRPATEDAQSDTRTGGPAEPLSPLMAAPDSPTEAKATGVQPTVSVPSRTISDAALRISVDGDDHTFLPGTDVTVGRDPKSTVRIGEQHTLVSRNHLFISYADDQWWIEDRSSKGTWIDHRRLKGRYKCEGAFLLNLGSDETGTPLRVIAKGIHRKPHTISTRLALSLSIGALLLVTFLVSLIVSARGKSLDYAEAKRSTVMLFGLEGGQGSGFFVAEDLIITNQHVAALSPQLLVGVSREADEPANIEYATEMVANHPFLDIAVIRISNRASISENGPSIDPGPVGDINLPVATIGDSRELTIGDPVFSTGFPGNLSITSSDEAGDLRLPPVVVSSGQLANFSLWPGCKNPGLEAFIPPESPPGVGCAPSGDIERGVLLSAFKSSEGASGSPVYTNDNEVVGVVYAGSPLESTASLDIASSSFAPWLNQILVATG